MRFSTQAEIDNFQNNYPDCKILNSEVSIEGDDIANLFGFSTVHNYVLTDIMGLGNLKSVGDGSISIRANFALTSLTGPENLDDGTLDFIQITYNKLLSSCDIQFICDHLASPKVDINIHDNAEGCNNQQEVETACRPGLY